MKRSLTNLCHCFALLLVLLTAAPSRAAAPSAQQIAETHFTSGLKHFERGDYEAARLAFLQAQAVYPRPSLLRNLALCELKTDRPLEALAHLRAYLADPSTTPDKRETAKKNFEDAFARTGHVRVRTNDGAMISVDGELQPGIAPLTEPVDVAVGRHVVVARLGERLVEREVVAAAGVVVDVDAALPEVSSAASVTPHGEAAAPPPRASFAAVSPPKEDAASFWTTRRIAGAGVAGAGALALAGALAFHLEADRALDRARAISRELPSNRACAGGGDPRCVDLDEAYDANDRNLVLGRVFGAVGAAAVVTGAVLVFLPSSRSSSRAVVSPNVGPSFAGLHIQGAF